MGIHKQKPLMHRQEKKISFSIQLHAGGLFNSIHTETFVSGFMQNAQFAMDKKHLGSPWDVGIYLLHGFSADRTEM